MPISPRSAILAIERRAETAAPRPTRVRAARSRPRRTRGRPARSSRCSSVQLRTARRQHIIGRRAILAWKGAASVASPPSARSPHAVAHPRRARRPHDADLTAFIGAQSNPVDTHDAGHVGRLGLPDRGLRGRVRAGQRRRRLRRGHRRRLRAIGPDRHVQRTGADAARRAAARCSSTGPSAAATIASGSRPSTCRTPGSGPTSAAA